MKIDRITYQKLFPLGVYINERIGVEIGLDDKDDYEETFEYAKKLVEDFHRKSNPSLYPKGNEPIVSEFIPEVQVEKTNEERRIAVMIQDMQTCKDLKTLETYKFLLKKFPQMEESYNQKLKELSQ